jgi:hypothetical protein
MTPKNIGHPVTLGKELDDENFNKLSKKSTEGK